CVTECPDTAILGKVIPQAQMEAALSKMPPEKRAQVEIDWAKTRKYWQANEKLKKEPGYFGIFIDPTKCKGCAECVQVCDDHALKMIKKTDTNMPVIQQKFTHFREQGPTPDQYINDKVLADMMLKDSALQYVGGAGSCAMGVRAKWNQQGWGSKRLWVIGGDGAMLDIGFQSLSRMLMSGMDIKVIVLDTQVYSNTGGQASTSTFMGQNTKMSVHGK